MPTFTLQNAVLFPVGTSVSCYRRGDWRLPGTRPKHAQIVPHRVEPPTSIDRTPPVATAAMLQGPLGPAATFDVPEGNYVFAAEVNGEWRYCHAMVHLGGSDRMPQISDPLLA